MNISAINFVAKIQYENVWSNPSVLCRKEKRCEIALNLWFKPCWDVMHICISCLSHTSELIDATWQIQIERYFYTVTALRSNDMDLCLVCDLSENQMKLNDKPTIVHRCSVCLRLDEFEMKWSVHSIRFRFQTMLTLSA